MKENPRQRWIKQFMGKRLALLIGNGTFQDKAISGLKSPPEDVKSMQKVLALPDIGGFDEVEPLIDGREGQIRRSIERFFKRKQADDLLLLYYAGHGFLDADGALYLAAGDTEKEFLQSSAVSAGWVADMMKGCRSRSIVLILDSCHSGAYGHSGAHGGDKAISRHTFESSGRGRIVLTATDALGLVFDGAYTPLKGVNSLFTHFLTQGLQTGEADTGRDGVITLNEWYDYVCMKVEEVYPKQKPQRWLYENQGDLVIARNPHFPTPEPRIAAEESWIIAVNTLIEIASDMASAGNQPQAVEVYRRALSLCPQDASQGAHIQELIDELSTAEMTTTAVHNQTTTAVDFSNPWGLPNEPLLGFIEIPPGSFLMGSNKQRDSKANDDELQQHKLNLPIYYIARNPTTAAQFRTFVKESGYVPRSMESQNGKDDHPVVHVNWFDALAYCQWLDEKLKAFSRELSGIEDLPEMQRAFWQGLRQGKLHVLLPSEAEWEKAARGPLDGENPGRIYPWGDRFEKSLANTNESGRGGTSPVGSYPRGASPYGVLDMAGNVWEWTHSLYKDYPYTLADGREDLEVSNHRVLRGGSWYLRQEHARVSSRSDSPPKFVWHDAGFRVAISYNLLNNRAAVDLRKAVVPQQHKPTTPDFSNPWGLSDEPLLGLLEISAGPFLMGSDKKENRTAYQDEFPQHELTLPTYYIARCPTTTAQFKMFINECGYSPKNKDSKKGKDDHPAVYVTWYDALAYCQWLDEKLKAFSREFSDIGNLPEEQRTFWQGLRQGKLQVLLPSEAEWEKAARGPLDGENPGRIYPWGNDFDKDLSNTKESGRGGILPVGSCPLGASPYGVQDMVGNVWEWTRSLYSGYPYQLDDGREELKADGRRVLRGGSWFSIHYDARLSFRSYFAPDFGWDFSGFRICVLSVPR